MRDATPFLPGLSPVGSKSLTAAQDAGNLSSNGGLIVLREAARRLGLAAVIADSLPDTRNPLLVIHSYRAMVTARVMAIAAGYEDADDLDALRQDPALLIACERAPESGQDIPSQPTISRLENLADAKVLHKIGSGFIDLFCKSYATAPTSIVLDIDDTDDMVHSQQELALFNTHAGGRCFQPIHIFEGNSGKPICRCSDPASGLRVRRSRACWPTSSLASAGTGRRSTSWCAQTGTTARRKCSICCARSAAATSSACPATRHSMRSPRPGASNANGAGSRASDACAASISSSTQPAPGHRGRR